MAHIVAGLVFYILCYLRICQTQDSWITVIKASKFIQGVVFKDKNPNPMKKCSRPFFGVLFGLCGGGPDGISASTGSHAVSLGGDGRLHKEGGTRLHHAFSSAYIASYREAARRIRGR